MGIKETLSRDNLGRIKSPNYSPSGCCPLPLALKRAEKARRRKELGKDWLTKMTRGGKIVAKS